MSEDIWDDPELQRWRKETTETLLPMIDSSAMVSTLLPSGEPDAKIAVELGFAILLDKPLFFVADPAGPPINDHLRRVADQIIEVDMSNPSKAAAEIQEKLAAFMDTHIRKEEPT